MKTFFEHFLDEIAREVEAKEIDTTEGQRRIQRMREEMDNFRKIYPNDPILIMPTEH